MIYKCRKKKSCSFFHKYKGYECFFKLCYLRTTHESLMQFILINEVSMLDKVRRLQEYLHFIY